jgi:cytoskeletal protein CcmA (bactofilin family)
VINGNTVQVDVIKQAADTIRIRSSVQAKNSLGYNKVVSQNAVLTATTNTNPFEYAAFGGNSVDMQNGKADSYNSNKGMYGGTNIDSSGDVGTNGSISFNPQGRIKGDASTGPGGTADTTKVTGTVTHSNALTFAPVSVPDSLKNRSEESAPSSGNIYGPSHKYASFSPNNVTINGNVAMYITGNLAMSGNSQISISAGSSLTIFIDGTVDLGGKGVINNDSIPSKFIIQSTYSGSAGVTIHGKGNLFGAIYAPNTQVDLKGNADVYGSIIANTLTNSGKNASIHYDEALAGTNVSTKTDTTFGYVAGTWTEQNTQ